MSLDTTTFFTAPQDLTSAPAWFNTLRAASWQDFTLLPDPSRREENWRFASLKKASLDGLSPACEASLPAAEDNALLEGAAAKFVFVNDHLAHSETGAIPAGVTCLPLADALTSHSDLIESHLCKAPARLGGAKFAALHASQLNNGIFIHVPQGLKVDGLIEVVHWSSGADSATFPHTLIITEDNSSVRVVEKFCSASDEPTLVVAVNDLITAPGAQLDYAAVQDLNTSSRFVQLNSNTVAENARARSLIMNMGAAWSRNESYSSLTGREAHSDMLSINLPFGEQECDQRTFQHHKAPGATSDLLYKNSLYDKAKTVFSGLIFVDEGAHQTDAYQTCRNLFMSDDAEANSMPGLEINADDVACSHGSTSSQVSEEEIFYLQARGIPSLQAKQMIARGFSIEVIERLGHEDLETYLLEHLDSKFARELKQV